MVKVRRKKSAQSVELGCVGMRGQRMTIRIITDEYLPMQKLNKFKYEVMSKTSEFRGNVDVIYAAADIHLSAGHMYYVRVNENQKVVRKVREVG